MGRTYERDCDHCGKHYRGRGKMYCSPECSSTAQRGTTYVEPTPCEAPGCEETHRNARYCSQQCQYDARRTNDRSPRPCEECGEDFTPPPNRPQQRFCSKTCVHDAQRTDRPEVELDADLLDYTYQADPEGGPGTYYFPVNGKLYPIPEDTWEYICECYSEMGRDMTRKEVAREVGISFPVLKRILRRAGQFKASLPFSRERIATEDEDALVEEALESKERKIVRRFQRKEQRKLEREHRKMYARLQDEARFVEAGRKVAEGMTVPPSPDIIVPDASMWPAALAITTDEHLGLPVWGDGSWGENYDTDIAARRLVGQGRSAAEWIAAQGGARVVYRAYAGDLFNAIFGSTTHDTPMDQDTRDEKVWDLAIQAVLGNAQPLRQVCDLLVIIFVSGNHDGPKVYQFASTMRFALEAHDDVEVRATPKKYDAVRVGDALHVFDHGANLTKLSGYKAIADAETVARKAGGEDYHGAEYIGYHVGHKHDRMVVTQGDHMELIRHPALCESSEYEHENRWVATPCADVMLLDERGRIDTPKRLYRDVLDEAGAA